MIAMAGHDADTGHSLTKTAQAISAGDWAGEKLVALFSSFFEGRESYSTSSG